MNLHFMFQARCVKFFEVFGIMRIYFTVFEFELFFARFAVNFFVADITWKF